MFFNTKTRTIFAVATSTLLLPMAAQAEEKTTFERDGVTYSYITTVEKNRTVIAGKTDNTVPFRLTIRGQRVTGHYNGNPVAFSLRDVKPSAPAVAVR